MAQDDPIPANDEDEYEIRSACSGTYGGQDVADCVERKATKSGQLLATAEQQMIKHIKSWDESDTYIQNALRTFATSQKDFITYRTSHCAFHHALNGGGTGYGVMMRKYACIAALNTRRTHELTALSSRLPAR